MQHIYYTYIYAPTILSDYLLACPASLFAHSHLWSFNSTNVRRRQISYFAKEVFEKETNCHL